MSCVVDNCVFMIYDRLIILNINGKSAYGIKKHKFTTANYI